MGEVYAAYDPELDRKVAIKLLRNESDAGMDPAEARSRLLREAQAIAKLSHPNVVVVFDVGTFEDRVFLAMEFVDGSTLGFWREKEKRSWRDILGYFQAAGRGLAAAHAAGVIHRDFKPDNVMVGRDGKIRVMDFGLARSVQPVSEAAVDAASATASAAAKSDPNKLGVSGGAGAAPRLTPTGASGGSGERPRART